MSQHQPVLFDSDAVGDVQLRTPEVTDILGQVTDCLAERQDTAQALRPACAGTRRRGGGRPARGRAVVNAGAAPAASSAGVKGGPAGEPKAKVRSSLAGSLGGLRDPHRWKSTPLMTSSRREMSCSGT